MIELRYLRRVVDFKIWLSHSNAAVSGLVSFSIFC